MKEREEEKPTRVSKLETTQVRARESETQEHNFHENYYFTHETCT